MINLDFKPNLDDAAWFKWPYLWMIGARHYRLFLFCFGPVALLTILYLLAAPRIYESTAVVQVEQRAQRAIQPIDNQSLPEDLTSENSIKTIEQNLLSYGLFLEVVSNPKIASDPDFLVGYTGSEKTPEDLADWLQSNTTVALRPGTRLIDVKVDHQVPAMAQKLAQSIVDSFVALNGRSQNAAEQSASKLLVAESEQVKENLQKSENSLQIYKDALLLRHRLDEQQSVVDALQQRYRDKHPQMIQARMLLGDLRQSFDVEFKKVIASSSSEADYWASKGNELASASATDRIATELKLVEARSDVLQKEVDTESALFNNVLKQMRETDVSQDAAATEIRLVESPALPTKAAKPKKAVILVLGLALGVLLGVGAVVLTHALKGAMETPMEAEAGLGLPVLGTIPRTPSAVPANGVPRNSTSSKSDGLVVISDPGGVAAEGFRSLRTVVDLLGKASEHRTILFTSALPGEGKTFVSCNYALALAQTGFRTLLVDTDLRRPGVHGRFSLDNKIGFVEMVTRDLELSQVVHAKVFKDLDVLTVGGRCPNPAELLAGSGFRELLAKGLAESGYDRIVFDSSPVNLVSDSLLIAALVDSVCLVVRAGSTARQASQYAITLLRRAQKEPSGIILNAVPPEGYRLHLGYEGDNALTYGQVYS